MPLSNASRLADFGTGIGTAGAIIQVDNPSQRVGIGTTDPDATLDVVGIVSATAFYGDGSNLDGVASAGLGTALSEVEFNPLTVIYQTSDTLSVGATITVDPPDSTTKVAYTQYSEVKLEGDADLIVAEGDDFIPDILGLSTEGAGGGAAYGNNVFNTIYADNIEKVDGRGAPTFPKGIYVTAGAASTFTGNISIGGTLTYEDVTNVDSIGVVTARNGIKVTAGGIEVAGGGANVTGVVTATGGIDVTAGGVKVTAGGIDAVGIITASTGFNAASNLILNTGGSERLRIGSAGQLGLSGANYGTDGQVLTSKGNSAAAQWITPAGGAWELIQNTDFGSDLGSPTFTYTGFTTAYSEYRVNVNQVGYVGGGAKRLHARAYMNGTLHDVSNGYYAKYSWTNYVGGNLSAGGATESNWWQLEGNSNNNYWQGSITIPQQPSIANFPKHSKMKADWLNEVFFVPFDVVNMNNVTGGSTEKQITGIRLQNGTDSTNLAFGRIQIYGLKAS